MSVNHTIVLVLIVSCVSSGIFLINQPFVSRALPPQLVFDSSRAVFLGDYYFSQKSYDLARAEQYFERAIELDSDAPDAWHQLARIDFLRGDFYSALEKINTQIILHGDSLMSSYYIRGLILGYMGRFSEAEGDFEKFVEWNSNGWAGWNDLSWVYFAQGKYEEAASAAKRGLDRHPGNPWLLNSYGVALLNVGEYQEAERALAYADEIVEVITPETWSQAYPGNDPTIAERGLTAFKETVSHNLSLAKSGAR